MPSSIPYNPSFVLGNIIDPKVLKLQEEMGRLQQTIDDAQEKMNSFISLRRSLDMTIVELTTMLINPLPLLAAREAASASVIEAATEYATVRIASETAIQALKIASRAVEMATKTYAESPIDYNLTEIKAMALSSDSLKMDAQYFSFDNNIQTSVSFTSKIKTFVEGTVGATVGPRIGAEASLAVAAQTTNQFENHTIDGTLVITAACTHRSADILAPFFLDPDKAIRVWNDVHTTDQLSPSNPASIMKAALLEGTPLDQPMHILSGATYGSSFVACVHVLKTETTVQTQNMVSVAAEMQAQFEGALYEADLAGSIGVSAEFAADFKAMMSNATVSAHVTLHTMGVIPSIKSNLLETTVKAYTEFSPDEIMGKLATMQDETSAGKSMASGAASARRSSKIVALDNAKTTNVITALGDLEAKQNKVIDVNSVMTAFEDFVDKIKEGNCGVPINYYLKPITKSQIAQAWVAKYYPNGLSIVGDDSERPKIEPRN